MLSRIFFGLCCELQKGGGVHFQLMIFDEGVTKLIFKIHQTLPAASHFILTRFAQFTCSFRTVSMQVNLCLHGETAQSLSERIAVQVEWMEWVGNVFGMATNIDPVVWF